MTQKHLNVNNKFFKMNNLNYSNEDKQNKLCFIVESKCSWKASSAKFIFMFCFEKDGCYFGKLQELEYGCLQVLRGQLG